MQQIKIYVLLLLLLLTVGCRQSSDTGTKAEFTAIVTILPYADFVHRIAGNEFKVEVLVPPGVSPEMFDPQPGELAKFRNAELYFRIGSVFTFENVLLEKIGTGNPDLEVVDCSEGISTQNNNPHIWLDPGKVKVIVENIFVNLAEKFPEKREEFLLNKNNFISEIDSLDKKLKLDFARFNNMHILTFHPAWGYFTDRYGIKEISIEKDGKTPSAKELAGLIKFARESRINTIFLEPQFDRDIVQSLAEQLDLRIVEIDPLAYDFIGNMSKVAGQFIESFE